VAAVYTWAYGQPAAGPCEGLTAKKDCLSATNRLEPSRPVCAWDIYSMTCSYREVDLFLYRVLLVTVRQSSAKGTALVPVA
jgi:hypothetical protein